ncbi:MAG TPA: cell division protein ZapA [Oscillospiraceae bacterium]|jgi:cell division protein ZapA|nr:Cell division protein ZapA [Oscillospiraceae bacterium]MDN5377791.1 cell division protein ZapA [Clostridiales bacterium]HOV41707.1 cell division protein ZapA [Oscillospiraceae bacterium]
MQNKVRVTICGKEYALQTDESPSYVIGLAKRLDRQITELVNSGDNISIQAAAIIAALSALDEANKSNESIDNIRTQIKEYVDDAGRARMERDEALKELELLRGKIASLENDIKLMQLKGSINA